MSDSCAICTLFEGEYHYGVGALANSLYEGGFEGTLWAGYRGEIPPWAKNGSERGNYYKLQVSDKFDISFVELKTHRHFSRFKPHFMIKVMEGTERSYKNIFYFDPDIVSKCKWKFYEEWVSHGVALCLDSDYPYMPRSHPLRLKWVQYAKSKGYKISKSYEPYYYNAGFIGLSIENKNIITIWRNLIDTLFEEEAIMEDQIKSGNRTRTFNVPDQDLLNLATMVSDCDLSIVGPSGMDFTRGGGYVMSHATLSPKPWEKNYVKQSVIDGKAPSLADKNFWRYTQYPINLLSKKEYILKKIDLKIGSALGRLTKS